MRGYVEITLNEFKKEIEDEMGFNCINANKGSFSDRGGFANEYIFERVIKHETPEDMMKALTGDGFRYAIRVYSSIDRNTNKLATLAQMQFVLHYTI